MFDKLLGKKKVASPPSEQAILIYLKGTGLDESVYNECDTSTLEDLLTNALGGTGEVDGNETGPTETVVFLYGVDAEQMFTRVQPVLGSYPLCEGARVAIRSGPPGSPERVVHLE